VKGKTIIQVNVDAKNILAEFTFDTERFSMDDFDEFRYGTLDVMDSRIGECAFDLAPYAV